MVGVYYLLGFVSQSVVSHVEEILVQFQLLEELNVGIEGMIQFLWWVVQVMIEGKKISEMAVEIYEWVMRSSIVGSVCVLNEGRVCWPLRNSSNYSHQILSHGTFALP